jgi:DNA polymerase-1
VSNLIVDLTNLSFRYVETKDYKTFPIRLVKDVLSFARSFDAENIICAMDYGKSAFRKQIYPDYKAGRFEKLSPEQQEKRMMFYENLNLVPNLLLENDISLLRFEGIEADDLLAYIVRTRGTEGFTLISSDTDLLQLEVTQFSPFKRNTDDKFISLDKLGFSSREEYVLAKSIAGDKSDNIIGVTGIGEKTALTILKKYSTNSFDTLITKLKESKKLGKREQGILDNEEIIRRNIELIDLYKNNEKIISPVMYEVEMILQGECYI